MTDLTIEDIKTGKVEARNKWEVRILASDLTGPYPVCFLATGKENNEQVVLRATATGRYSDTDDKPHAFDLVFIVKPQYFNIYTRKDGTAVVGMMNEGVESSVCLGDMTIDIGDGGTFEIFRYCNGDVTKVEPGERDYCYETFQYLHGEVIKVGPEEYE